MVDKTIPQLEPVSEITVGDYMPIWSNGTTVRATFGQHVPYLINGVIPEGLLPEGRGGDALAAALLTGLDESGRAAFIGAMGGVRMSDLDDPLYATSAEITTGTDAEKLVTPDALAASSVGTKVVQIEVFGPTVEHATGDGKAYFMIPSDMNGMNLVRVSAAIITAGTTGVVTFQIHNLTDAVDMLTTKITIDSTETTTATAATPAVIATAADDVATDDVIRIDCDTVHTTEGFGAIVSMEFRKP